MLSIIVAVAKNQVIGQQGDLPWRLSDDLKRFKRITMGHHLVMGRKTYESIGRPLPGRTSIVLTNDQDYQAEGCFIANSVDEALQLSKDDTAVFVIGGAQVYRSFLPVADRLHWTAVMADVTGDTFFPAVDWSEWKMTSESHHSANEKNQFDTVYKIFARIQADSANQ